MSITLMTSVWKSSLPCGRKMVLLALCDNANDRGECYPSISMLADKCSLSERSVQQHIADLEKEGIVRRAMRGGRSTVYYINSGKICTRVESIPPQILHPVDSAPAKNSSCTSADAALNPREICTPADSAPQQNLHPTPANFAPSPPQILHPTPADFAPITVIEPSVESSLNRGGRAAQRKTALPENWQLPKKMGEWALAEYPHWSAEHVRKVAEKFHDHWLSVGGVKKDWEATWRNWCRNESRAWTALPRAAPVRGFESEKDKARRAVAQAISGQGAGTHGRIIDIGSGAVRASSVG